MEDADRGAPARPGFEEVEGEGLHERDDHLPILWLHRDRTAEVSDQSHPWCLQEPGVYDLAFE